MHPLEYAYNFILNTVGLGVLPWVWSTAKNDLTFRKGRWGCYGPVPVAGNRPRIWIHAASVGEVTGAIPILRVLHDRLPKASICLTVATPQGFRYARAHLPQWARIYPFPLDFPWILKKALRYLQPDLYVSLESEFWPNLFRCLRRSKLPCVLLNGRLSRRSARFYNLLRPLFQPIFEQFQWLAMHSGADMKNILGLGAPRDRTLLLGSSKYEGLFSRCDPATTRYWRQRLSLFPGTPVLIGGSLRRSECIELPRIFLALKASEPRLVGIFAPRHLEQIPAMANWMRNHGLAYQMLSRLESGTQLRQTSTAILVDRIGILFELYALGDLIFCGGTLEPIGGHNILEPAAWEKPVFYGPHLQKVDYEHSILQSCGGSFPVRDAQDLLCQWRSWIERLPQLQRHGKNGARALRDLGGVVAKQVELILNALAARELGC